METLAYYKQVPAKNKQGYKWKCTEDGPPDPMTGKRRQITRRADGKKEAKAKVDAALHEMKLNENQPLNKDIRFKDFLPDWVDTYKKGKVKPSTYAAHKRNIKTHLIPTFGQMKIKDLSRHQYQKYINKLLEDRKSTTVKHINATMSNALRTAVDLNMIIKNPSTGVIIKKVDEPENEKIHYWGKREIKVFLEVCKEDNMMYYFYFLTLIRTGMRKGEAMAIQWEDINFEKGEISINKTLLYHVSKEEAAFGPPKTPSSFRTIKIDKFLCEELKKLNLLQKKNKLLLGDKYSTLHFVFCKSNGFRLRERTLQTAFERLKRKSEVTNIVIHDLRHTHAVMLLEAGVSMKEIQERLGHKDIMTTGNIYSHVTESMEMKSIEKFSEYMTDSNSN